MRKSARYIGAVAISIWQALRARPIQLLGFGVLTSVLGAVLVVPLGTWLGTRLIATTGRLAVANQEIAVFLLTPAGLATLVVFLITALVTYLIGLTGPMLIDTARLADRRLTAFAALWFTLHRLPGLVRVGLGQVVRYAAIALPIVGVAAGAVFLLLSEHDINFYLAERPLQFVVALAIVGAAAVAAGVVGLVLYVRWILAVPIRLFEGERATVAIRLSRQRVRGRFWEVALPIAALWAALGAIGVLLTLSFDGLAEVVTIVAGRSLALTVMLLGSLLAVYLAALGLLQIAGAVIFALLILRLYDAASIAAGLRPGPAAGAGPLRAQVTQLVGTRAPIPAWVRWAAPAVFLGFGALLSVRLIEQLNIEDRVEITAHRGASVRAPENTLAAIERAIAENADYAEIDVQETADGAIVIIHDPDLMRIAGVNRKIWEVPLDELRQLDVGKWFGEEFAGERIPTLQEVIDVARGRIKLNIELKYNGHDRRLAERTADVVHRNGFEDEVVITSLEYHGLEETRRVGDRLSVGFIVARSVGRPWSLDVDLLSVEAALVKPGVVAAAHTRGKQVHVWTVNDPTRMSRLIDLGVDNLITDDPLLARQVLAERAELSDVERLILYLRHRFDL